MIHCSTHLSVHLVIYPSTRPSTYLSVHLSIKWSINQPVNLLTQGVNFCSCDLLDIIYLRYNDLLEVAQCILDIQTPMIFRRDVVIVNFEDRLKYYHQYRKEKEKKKGNHMPPMPKRRVYTLNARSHSKQVSTQCCNWIHWVASALATVSVTAISALITFTQAFKQI